MKHLKKLSREELRKVSGGLRIDDKPGCTCGCGAYDPNSTDPIACSRWCDCACKRSTCGKSIEDINP